MPGFGRTERPWVRRTLTSAPGALAVVEGISSVLDAGALRELGFPLGLGPLYGGPMEAGALEQSLTSHELPFTIVDSSPDRGTAGRTGLEVYR